MKENQGLMRISEREALPVTTDFSSDVRGILTEAQGRMSTLAPGRRTAA